MSIGTWPARFVKRSLIAGKRAVNSLAAVSDITSRASAEMCHPSRESVCDADDRCHSLSAADREVDGDA
jgi:hypothetical protein